jgi:hypothetical protein
MRPIRATPSSAEPSDQTGGTPAQTARRSSGSAPPHCEASRPPAGPCRAGALASESRPAVPVPDSGPCLGPIGWRPRQGARLKARDGRLRYRRVDHQGLPHVLGLKPSLALAPVPTTPSGMARASQAKGSAVPHLPRATGLGPVCSLLFLPASWSRPATFPPN